MDTAATTTLPERCIVIGYVNRHVSPFDTCTYQNGFQVQLPLPANWNGRFMGQGGGGSEGSIPAATVPIPAARAEILASPTATRWPAKTAAMRTPI